MSKQIVINQKIISAQSVPYIIAEISANHNGSIKTALEAILAAKKAGVDAVKIQSYTPDTMTIKSSKGDFMIKDGIWKNKSLYDLYKEAHTPFEWHKEIFEFAKENKITLFSTPFDESAVDLLESLNTPAYKVASFELVDLPLISYIAKTKKPLLMSTGMASLTEINDAIETAKLQGNNDIVIFHCISSYPATIQESKLNGIKLLKKEFDVIVGLSDHTLGNLASIVAVSLGASVIEKHFTLSRSNGGVDSSFSTEPDEMKLLVKDVGEAYLSIGKNTNNIRSKTENLNKTFRRSIYFVKNIKKGEVITQKHIKRIRPGYGLEPKFYYDVLGKKVTKNFTKGERVTKKSFC